jgi:predicted nucleic acid-binding protein
MPPRDGIPRDRTKLLIVDASVVVDAFDTTSVHSSAADSFLQTAHDRGFSLVMPMHGFFEIKCAMHRIVHIDKRKIAPRYQAFHSALRMIAQPIDHKFIEDYAHVDVPYARAGDTIYLVMAKRLGLPLVTRDGAMLKNAKAAGIPAVGVLEATAILIRK